jgi:aspartyl-tRNA(Asn)/glutamyl-tRNA(Gln) amidotransferase subunit C
MSITQADVLRAGKLARIRIHNSNLEKVASQLTGVFNWIDQLNQAHSQIQNQALIVDTQYRHLEHPDTDPVKDQRNLVLQNAPHRVHDFFAVPKVKE